MLFIILQVIITYYINGIITPRPLIKWLLLPWLLFMWLLCCGHYYCGYYGMDVWKGKSPTRPTHFSFLLSTLINICNLSSGIFSHSQFYKSIFGQNSTLQTLECFRLALQLKELNILTITYSNIYQLNYLFFKSQKDLAI